MNLINFLSLSVSPILIVAFILYLRFKFSIKSYVNIRNAIILGVVSVILLLIAQFVINQYWGGRYNNMRRMAFYVFIIIGFCSEFGKFLPLRLIFYKLKNFTGPLEGIVYSIFISLGFSFVAGILYVFGIVGAIEKINNFELFLYTFPIANVIFGITMGFFVGLGATRKNSFIDLSTGLFVATFFHGLFYLSFITSDIRLLIFDTIGFIIIAITLIVKAVNLKQDSFNK